MGRNSVRGGRIIVIIIIIGFLIIRWRQEVERQEMSGEREWEVRELLIKSPFVGYLGLVIW